MNQIPFLDNGVILLKEDEQTASPIGVVYYEKYSELESVISRLETEKEGIQCTISNLPEIPGSIRHGGSQQPGLTDYADGIDTMEFLTSLY